jgi:hypothetical protein
MFVSICICEARLNFVHRTFEEAIENDESDDPVATWIM